MQEKRGSSGLIRERDCCEASPGRAERAGRTLVAREASASDSVAMTVREAGRRGGLSCLRNQGRRFFVEIGKKGQFEMRRKHPNMAGKWGKMGGRPKRLTLREIMGEAKK